VDIAHQYYADNFCSHTPLHPEQSGVEGQKELLADAARAAPKSRQQILHIAAEGDLVFVHIQTTFIQEGKAQTARYFRDAEPHEQEETAKGIALYRIEEGKIAEQWIYHNLADYVQRHGASPMPGQAREVGE